MINYSGWKLDRTLKNITVRLTREEHFSFCDLDRAWYLGGGFWRAFVDRLEHNISLINPDRTPEEIRIVEQAICLLTGFNYVNGKVSVYDVDESEELIKALEDDNRSLPDREQRINHSIGSEHFKKYDKLARLIGINKLKKEIPLTYEAAREALKQDEHLNNIPLRMWDAWAGKIREDEKTGRIDLSYSGIWNEARHLNIHSLAERVCLLKHITRYYIAGEYWW